MMPAYPFEEAYFLDKAKAVRERVGMPLILLGGINNRATIDLAMSEGFQFVAMGRALLREPDLLQRMQAGETDAGNCIHCQPVHADDLLREPMRRRPPGTHRGAGRPHHPLTWPTTRSPSRKPHRTPR